MSKLLVDAPLQPEEGILRHEEDVDLIPANIELSGMEVSLVNAMSREKVLKQYLDDIKRDYDYILLDCMPALGMLTINALAAADSVLIPLQAQYLPAKGLEQFLLTINKVRRQINPKLKIDGILLTMVDNRTNYARRSAVYSVIPMAQNSICSLRRSRIPSTPLKSVQRAKTFSPTTLKARSQKRIEI